MTKALVTFIGGPECGNIGSTEWGTAATGIITFPLNQPVLLDPDAAGQDRAFVAHVVDKARTNPFFRVEDAADAAGPPASATHPAPEKPAGRAGRRKAA